jgi:hypothetical protein
MVKFSSFQHVKAALRFGACLTLVLNSGCMSLENEEARLPDGMRSAMASLTAKGYPDLTKIPDAPKDLPSATAWSSLESGLVTQGAAVAANPEAKALVPGDTDLAWAAQDRAALEADPRAEPLPAAVPGTATEPDWAVEARKKLEADLARLPPP